VRALNESLQTDITGGTNSTSNISYDNGHSGGNSTPN
jgi:hypothetical protein